MPSLADYLKIDGSNSLLDGLNFPNLEINEFSASALQVVIKGTSTWRDLKARNFNANVFAGNAKNTYFDQANIADSVVHFRSRHGGYQTLAKMNVGNFEISKAGNIIPAVTNTYNFGSPALRWNNGYFKLFAAETGWFTGDIYVEAFTGGGDQDVRVGNDGLLYAV